MGSRNYHRIDIGVCTGSGLRPWAGWYGKPSTGRATTDPESQRRSHEGAAGRGFLRQQIQLGIQEYINKQKEAQVAAQAEQARLANEKVKNVRRATRDHIYGNPNAPISLIEYSDFECPFCKNFHKTAKDIVKTYDGKVNWVYRHFPLNFHNPGAQKQAEASECAEELGGNNAFWRYTDAVYERTKSNENGFPLTQLVPLAKELGLNEKQFAQCMKAGSTKIG